jgi:hypothetical protein
VSAVSVTIDASCRFLRSGCPRASLLFIGQKWLELAERVENETYNLSLRHRMHVAHEGDGQLRAHRRYGPYFLNATNIERTSSNGPRGGVTRCALHREL